ncbi:DUF899 family protein [Rhodovibrionaceae bacterium A322]
MTVLHDMTFPNESAEYRAARNDLLLAERDLRRQTEKVAALRRALPPGGRLKEDYCLTGPAGPVRLSSLFRPDSDTLFVYNFMLAPGGAPCPACTSFCDSLNGTARHLMKFHGLAVVAEAPLSEFQALADSRPWPHLPIYSSNGTTFKQDYRAVSAEGGQLPLLLVFRQTPDGIVLTYASELLFADSDEGQHPRHIDPCWPLWNLLDLTPGGRGQAFPSLD